MLRGTLKAMLKVVGFMDIGLAKFSSGDASSGGEDDLEQLCAHVQTFLQLHQHPCTSLPPQQH